MWFSAIMVNTYILYLKEIMSQTLHITRGIPGSGKSTFAADWQRKDPVNRAIVSRDAIRFSVFGKYVLPPELEPIITSLELAQLRALLKAGKSVMVDNVNLRAKYIKPYLKLAAEYRVVVLHKDFPIELSEALKRNRERERKVDEKVIERMYSNFLKKGGFPPFPYLEEVPDVYVPDTTKPAAWIVDVDGTLAEMTVNGRSPHDWHRVLEDDPRPAVIALVRLLHAAGKVILITSGRDAICAEDTALWLAAEEVPYHELFMRPHDDRRKDFIVKKEIFDEKIRYNYNIEGVLDDRLQVARLWHELGLPLFRVGDPEADF
jgi:predicted kinase